MSEAIALNAKEQQILTRYLKGYVTDAQLHRYYEKGVIVSEEHYWYIYNQKHLDDTKAEQPTDYAE